MKFLHNWRTLDLEFFNRIFRCQFQSIALLNAVFFHLQMLKKGMKDSLQLSQGYRSNVCDMKISNGSHKDMGLGYICIQAQLL